MLAYPGKLRICRGNSRSWLLEESSVLLPQGEEDIMIAQRDVPSRAEKKGYIYHRPATPNREEHATATLQCVVRVIR